MKERNTKKKGKIFFSYSTKLDMEECFGQSPINTLSREKRGETDEEDLPD